LAGVKKKVAPNFSSDGVLVRSKPARTATSDVSVADNGVGIPA